MRIVNIYNNKQSCIKSKKEKKQKETLYHFMRK